jgi:hypothetical protein
MPQRDTPERPDWEYVAPRPGQADLAPSAEYLAALKTNYLGEQPKVSVCAPFVAISDSQDPTRICDAAQHFGNYFSRSFSARRPPTWIALIHYALGDDRLYEHTRRTMGDIGCNGVLGYFDWQRQAVVFRAPPGFFGTFQHELAHALDRSADPRPEQPPRPSPRPYGPRRPRFMTSEDAAGAGIVV